MTLYALGDYHGRSLDEFEEKINLEYGDKLISTGDFDQVGVIHQFLNLKRKLGEENVIDVGANHDHAILERLPIASSTIESQSKHYHEMMDELHQDLEAKNYLKEIVENPVKEFEFGGLNGVVVHGGLAGHIQNSNISEEMKNFWYRLWDDEHFEDNFDLMDQRDYDIMIRGHDHRRDHALRPKYGYSPTFRSHFDESYEIDPDYNHIITHGSWFDGEYVKIEKDPLEIRFESI